MKSMGPPWLSPQWRVCECVCVCVCVCVCIHEVPLYISTTELSSYQILKRNSNNDIRNAN